jgi:putative peptidoglycan lipid II flippase
MAFIRNAASLGLATILSRLLGFGRDVLVAGALGAGPAADAFVVAFRIPSLLRRLLSEGAFNGAFVPLHAEAARRGEGTNFAAEVLAAMAAGFATLTALALAGMPLLIRLIAPGLEDGGGDPALATALSRITFPFCLATALMVVAGGLLNVHGRYGAAAFAPALVNVVTILALLGARAAGLTDEVDLAFLLAWSVLLGGIAQCVLVAAALRCAAIAVPLVLPRVTPAVRRFLRLAAPAVAAGGITQVNAFVGLVVASSEPGAVAWLYYADRLYQLPLGILAVAIGIALLPDLARHSAAGDKAGETAAFSRAGEVAGFLALPAAIGLIIAAEPIIAVLFERDAFTAADTRETAAVLAAYATGLPAFVGAKLVQPLFFARTRMRLPFVVALLGVAIDIGLSVALFPIFGPVGVAAAASAAGWLNLALLVVAARLGGYAGLDHKARRRLVSTALATVPMTLAVLALMPLLAPLTGAGTPLLLRLAALGGLVGGGLLTYLLAALALGAIDVRALRAALRKAPAAGGS